MRLRILAIVLACVPATAALALNIDNRDVPTGCEWLHRQYSNAHQHDSFSGRNRWKCYYNLLFDRWLADR